MLMTVLWKNTVYLYVNGFRSMVLGRQLWTIILFKIVIIFGVIKIFFFPDVLTTTYATDQERAAHVLSALTQTNPERPFPPDINVSGGNTLPTTSNP